MNWVVIVLISAVLFSFGNIIRKLVLKKEHALEFLAARSFFMIPLLLCIAPLIPLSIDSRTLAIIYASSLIATAAFFYQAKAVRHSDISFYSPLETLVPILVLALAYTFLGETVTLAQFLGILAFVIGSLLITSEPGKRRFDIRLVSRECWTCIGLALVLLAVACALDKFILGFVLPSTYVFYLLLFISINFIVLDYLQFGWRHVATDFRKGGHWLLLIALTSIVATLAFFHAIADSLVLISLALPLRRVSVILDTIFGGAIFKEENLVRRIFACLIMLVGVVLVLV